MFRSYGLGIAVTYSVIEIIFHKPSLMAFDLYKVLYSDGLIDTHT